MNDLQFSDPGFDYTHQDDLVFLSQTMDERDLIIQDSPNVTHTS